MAGDEVSTRVDTTGRRKFTLVEKKQIVREYCAADSQTGRGQVLRRWGTFQQNVSRWKKQIDDETLGQQQKNAKGKNKDLVKVRELEAKLVKSEARVKLLDKLVEAQGKALGLHAKTVGSRD